jgi:uncharacterized protein (DUF885 family)
MKRFLRWTGGLLGITLLVILALVVNVVWFRPLSINWFYERAFIEFALEDPELLSSIRLLEGFGIDGHNAELTDVSPAQARTMFELMRKDMDILHSYDRGKLEGQTALSYDVLDWYLGQQLDGEAFLWHNYTVDQFNGVHVLLPDFLVTVQQIETVRDAEHYNARLAKFGWKFDSLLETLRMQEERGIVPPRFAIGAAIEQIDLFTAPAPRQNELYLSLSRKLDDIAGLAPDDRTRLLSDAGQQLETTVYPAYAELREYLAGQYERTLTNHGVWNLPDGDAFYRHKLAEHTTTNLDAETIHALGLAEVDRITAEMDGLLHAEGYAEGSVGQRMQRLSVEPRFLFPDTDEGREQVLDYYRQLVQRANDRVDEYFLRKPATPVEVRRMPEYLEANNAIAYYVGPAFDRSRPGVFFAKLTTTAEHPRFKMPVVAYHEAVPGHHFQTALQTELEGVAQFRRIIPFTAFSEGWGLYTEQLAAEMGLIENPYDQLGRLQTELWRAVRLVVDTGIHKERWTREEAIDYMLKLTGIPASDVAVEIDRYFVFPGQATAYKVGMMKILELRERARQALGDDFDIREFHDVVLRNGAIPLVILEQQVEAYIDVAQTRGSE